MTDTTKPTTFGDASGKTKADANLNVFIGKTIVIRSYTAEAREFTDKETKEKKTTSLFYITIDPQTVRVEDADVKAKVLYTWSGVVGGQLEQIKDKLGEDGSGVSAKVISKKGSQAGKYIALE